MKSIITMLLLALSLGATAQMTKDSLTKAMALEICKEMEKKDFSKVTAEDLDTEIGLAFMPVFSKYEKDLKEVFELTDMTDQDKMRQIGQEVGQKLAMNCPSFVKIITNLQKSSKDDKVEEIREEVKAPVADDLSLSGTFLKILPGEVSSFQVKAANGKIEKILWLEYFEGAYLLTDSPAKLINKKVSVRYVEKEIYNTVKKSYNKVKVAVGIELSE